MNFTVPVLIKLLLESVTLATTLTVLPTFVVISSTAIFELIIMSFTVTVDLALEEA